MPTGPLFYGINSLTEGSFSQVTLVYIKVTKPSTLDEMTQACSTWEVESQEKTADLHSNSRPVRVVPWDCLKRRKKRRLERRLSSSSRAFECSFQHHTRQFITAYNFSSTGSNFSNLLRYLHPHAHPHTNKMHLKKKLLKKKRNVKSSSI